jgi:hypothetical protein
MILTVCPLIMPHKPSSQAIAEINRLMQDSTDAMDILKQEMNEGIETISSSQVIQPRSIDEKEEEKLNYR